MRSAIELLITYMKSRKGILTQYRLNGPHYLLLAMTRGSPMYPRTRIGHINQAFSGGNWGLPRYGDGDHPGTGVLRGEDRDPLTPRTGGFLGAKPLSHYLTQFLLLKYEL